MLNFRSKPRPHRPSSAGQVRRLVYLFGALLLVVFMMSEVRRGRAVALFARLFGDRAPQQAGPSAPAVSAAPQEAAAGVDTSPRKPLEAPHPERPFYERVRPDLLNELVENVRFLPAEKNAFFHLLRLLKETDAATIAAAPAQRVTRYELWTQSAAYRGKLVSVAGRVRGARKMPMRDNPDGIRDYFELWLQPEGHSDEPVVAYCLELPAGFPVSMDPKQVDEKVDIKGFYYRRWWYLAKEGNRVDPLMLAKTFSWTPARPTGGRELNLPLAIAIAAGLAALAVALLVWRLRGASRSKKLPDYVQRYAKGGSTESAEEASVREVLRRLEDGQGSS